MTENNSTPPRKIGPVTVAASGSAGAGYALAVLISWALSLAGVDMPESVQSALGLVITTAGGLLGGYLVRPRE